MQKREVCTASSTFALFALVVMIAWTLLGREVKMKIRKFENPEIWPLEMKFEMSFREIGLFLNR
jgi:hypothetical protein